MATLVYELNQSLDGYIDHMRMGPPNLALFHHFTARTREITGMIYGRAMYEAMRYWDEDRAEWGADQHAYAAAWRSKPKWVVSRTLREVGPNATLVTDAGAIGAIKSAQTGIIEVAGPTLAASLTHLIDTYCLYVHPVVLGHGAPFFAGTPPALRFVATDVIAGNIVRLTYDAVR
jgi:dihydrofolate reductase